MRVLVVLLLVGCGAKTAPETPRMDAGAFDAGPAECDDDGDCDDGVDCTEDRCSSNVCVRTPRSDRCGDDLFCTVGERCDPLAGCVSEPNACSDGVDCTEDTCDEARDRCSSEPRFDRCPLSHRCDPEIGCVARALVHDDDDLWEVDLPSGNLTRLAPAEISFTDLALHPDGTAWAINRTALFELDQATGLVEFVANLPDGNVALDVSPEGELLTAGLTTVDTIDRATGASRPIAMFPPGRFASGDIAFVRGRMLVTATDNPGVSVGSDDWLMEVPPDGGRIVEIGTTGFPCIWGLAPFGETLYGFTCRGLLIEIDPDTGRARQLARLRGLRIGGAAAR